ncbi:hypothetical protein LXL04_007009 [Taraxacum kok-saghyz]
MAVLLTKLCIADLFTKGFGAHQLRVLLNNMSIMLHLEGNYGVALRNPNTVKPFERVFNQIELRSFENSYIPENPRTHKPLTFSKNRLRGAKNRSNLRLFAYMQKKIRAYVHVLRFCFKNSQIPEIFLKFFYRSLYTTYLKGFFTKKFEKKRKKKKVAYMQKLKKKVAYMQKLKKNIRILFILNVLEGSEVGFLKGITVWEIYEIGGVLGIKYLVKVEAELSSCNLKKDNDRVALRELDSST